MACTHRKNSYYAETMLISYARLQTFFTEPLPAVDELSDLLTFHAWEIDEVIPKPEFNDTILDVKVLPDKSSWALSHVGVAREIATLLGRKLAVDPVTRGEISTFFPVRQSQTKMDAKNCDRYTLARIDGVKVAPSPKWLSGFFFKKTTKSDSAKKPRLSSAILYISFAIETNKSASSLFVAVERSISFESLGRA